METFLWTREFVCRCGDGGGGNIARFAALHRDDRARRDADVRLALAPESEESARGFLYDFIGDFAASAAELVEGGGKCVFYGFSCAFYDFCHVMLPPWGRFFRRPGTSTTAARFGRCSW